MLKRFYVPEISAEKIILPDFESHHAINVMRVEKGQIIEIFDGKGKYAQAKIIGISKSKVEILADIIEQSPEPELKITLGLAIPKYSRQEALVLMCSELGIWRFSPIIFSRSSVRENFRTGKWHRWAIQACKQSRRNYLPQIDTPVSFDDFINRNVQEYDCIILGEYGSKNSLENIKNCLIAKRNILIVIGPEGGFTEQELSDIRSAGAIDMFVGRHILRTETAAVALSAAVLSLSDVANSDS